jgi:hypothetical protein
MERANQALMKTVRIDKEKFPTVEYLFSEANRLEVECEGDLERAIMLWYCSRRVETAWETERLNHRTQLLRHKAFFMAGNMDFDDPDSGGTLVLCYDYSRKDVSDDVYKRKDFEAVRSLCPDGVLSAPTWARKVETPVQ